MAFVAKVFGIFLTLTILLVLGIATRDQKPSAPRMPISLEIKCPMGSKIEESRDDHGFKRTCVSKGNGEVVGPTSLYKAGVWTIAHPDGRSLSIDEQGNWMVQ